MRRRHELSDEEWEAVDPLLPGREGDPGRTAADNRLFVNAVLFVAKTAIPWRDLPERFGKWNSVWRRFDRWCASGAWPALAGVPGGPDLTELHLDSTTVRARHSAAGGRAGAARRPAEEKKRPTSAAASGVPAAAGRARSTPR